MFMPFPLQTYRAFVWLLDLYGGSFGSYLTTALENEVLKYHRPGQGHFEDTPVVFIYDFDFV